MVSFEKFKIQKFNDPIKNQAGKWVKRSQTKNRARFWIAKKDPQHWMLKINPKIPKLHEIALEPATSINNKILKKLQDAMYIYVDKATINCSRVSNASRTLQIRNNWL